MNIMENVNNSQLKESAVIDNRTYSGAPYWGQRDVVYRC